MFRVLAEQQQIDREKFCEPMARIAALNLGMHCFTWFPLRRRGVA